MASPRSDLGTIRGLRRRCSLFRAELADRGTPGEVLRDHWLGGAANTEPGLAGWIYCYGSYRTLLDGGSLTPAATTAPDDALEQVLMDAARDVPQSVDLVDPDGDGKPRRVTVYPKSYDALVWVDVVDHLTTSLLAHAGILKRSDAAGAPMHYAAAMRAVSLNHQTMAWIACTPGPETPFPGFDLPDAVPAPYNGLNEVDLMLVLRAYHAVNKNRHARMTAGLHGGDRGTAARGSWISVAAAAAERFGERLEDLLRKRSLGAWLAQLIVAVRSERERHTGAWDAAEGG